MYLSSDRAKIRAHNFPLQYLLQLYSKNLTIMLEPFTGTLRMGWCWSWGSNFGYCVCNGEYRRCEAFWDLAAILVALCAIVLSQSRQRWRGLARGPPSLCVVGIGRWPWNGSVLMGCDRADWWSEMSEMKTMMYRWVSEACGMNAEWHGT